MRQSLKTHLKISKNSHVALAGMFRILNGKIKSHVQPDYDDVKIDYYDPN